MGRRILVIDDNSINRCVVEKQLSAAGMRAALVSDVDQGLALLGAAAGGHDPFEAVVVDHMMPNRDGLDLAPSIRMQPNLTGKKLLLCSSSGLVGEATNAQALGFDSYLTKPVGQSALIAQLARFFPD